MSYYQQQDISFVPLTPEEERQLFNSYYAGDLAARDELIARHLKFVAKTALAYAKHYLEPDEAISAGNNALMQVLAAKRFDPSRGARFTSYLKLFIHGEVRAALKAKQGVGGLPPGTALPLEELPSFTRENLPDDEPATKDRADWQQLLENLLAVARERLSPSEFATIEAALQGENQSEHAKRRGVTRQATQQAFNRARRKLAAELNGMMRELLCVS